MLILSVHYVYACICVCMHIFAHVCVNTCLCVCACVCAHAFVCVCVYVGVCMCICVCVCTCVCVWVSEWASLCSYVCVHVYMYIRVQCSTVLRNRLIPIKQKLIICVLLYRKCEWDSWHSLQTTYFSLPIIHDQFHSLIDIVISYHV